MKIEQFYELHNRRPTFVLTKTIKVTSYLWYMGSHPHQSPKKVTLKKGMVLVRNGYSNFGDGHSMSKLKGPPSRWFRVAYSAMEHAGWTNA